MFRKISVTLPFLVAAFLVACGKQEAPTAPAPQAQAPAPAAAPAPAPQAAAPVNNPVGEGVYKKTCVMCHSSGVGGAPKVGDAADWGARLAKGGVDQLHAHAIAGFTGEKGMMPAKGGNPALTDDEVKAGVDFMVAKSK